LILVLENGSLLFSAYGGSNNYLIFILSNLRSFENFVS
jgi:hypothetical protein